MTNTNRYAIDTQQRPRKTWRQVLEESAPLLLPVAARVAMTRSACALTMRPTRVPRAVKTGYASRQIA